MCPELLARWAFTTLLIDRTTVHVWGEEPPTQLVSWMTSPSHQMYRGNDSALTVQIGLELMDQVTSVVLTSAANVRVSGVRISVV